MVDTIYGGENNDKTGLEFQMKKRFISALLIAITVSGCGVLFPNGDDWDFGGGSGGSGFNPETVVTTGTFSMTYHAGSTKSFAEGTEKVASSVYDGTKTTVRMRSVLLTNGKYAYNMILTFPGDTTGTFQVGTENVLGTVISTDGSTDAGEWLGSNSTAPNLCTSEQNNLVASGFMSITGYGAVGERVVGTYDLYFGGTFACGTIKRFQGSFSVVRGT